MKEDEKKRILKKYDPDVLPIELVQHIYEETEGLDPLTKMSDVDIQIWLEGDIYLNVDKMSTAAGLEIRMPLTDRRIFDIASRMPARFKVNEEQNKVASARRRRKFCRRRLRSARSWASSCRSVSGWRMRDTTGMCAGCSTARLRRNSSMWKRSTRSLTSMWEETPTTGEKCGRSILSLYGMRNIS